MSVEWEALDVDDKLVVRRMARALLKAGAYKGSEGDALSDCTLILVETFDTFRCGYHNPNSCNGQSAYCFKTYTKVGDA